MTRLIDRPDWRACVKIIREEAAKAGAEYDDVAMFSRTPKAVSSRKSAVRRILKETSCTQTGLAQVWGISVGLIRQALAETGDKRAYTAPPRPQKVRPTYDPATSERLRWAHGDARAAQIIQGQDPQTRWDIASWKRATQGGTAA